MDYFAANDIAAFIVESGTPTESAAAGRFDATYTTKSINTNGTGAIKSPQIIDPTTGAATSLTDAWAHFSYLTANFGSAISIFELINAAGTAVVRLFQTTFGTFRPEYWNGAAWVQTAGTFNAGTNVLIDIDIHVVCGLAGSINFYVNGSLAVTIAGLNAAVNNIAFCRITSNQSVNGYSQILISDANTVGAKVASLVPNANGANTAWANDFNNVVKVGYNDATLISSAVLGDKETYGATNATLPGGANVSSVWFAARARLSTVSPVNFKPLLRIGGVDYVGAYNFGGLSSASFGPAVAGFAVDPSTVAAWTIANVNAAEVGVQSAA